ncbi:MAG: amino acid ABC transporter permease [Acidimicrobiaceae bacterium]|nr:amino acid ABC transporter permease [Acidimicrobiaceae bacterium]
MTATVAPTRVPIWRDVRVLQWLFQLLVVAVAAAVVIWLFGNYRTNSENQGIPTSFDFLDNPASFEITGNDMSQNASVRTALVQGFLNTMRISVAGIVAATVLGTIIGVARLSKNWLVNKMAAVYVEAIRNVPLPLFVVFGALAVVLGVFPRIQEAWEPAGLMVISNRGIAGPWFTGSGRWLIVIGIVGAVAWWAVARWRRAVSDRSGAPANSGLWGGAAFAIVVVVGWAALGFGVTLPEVDGRRSAGGIRIDPSFFAIFFALVIYTASHIAEIVRGSIQAVPRGQGEAANALALSGFQRMWYVVLPQAFRIAIPPVGNQYLNLIKNSSLGAGIGYYDITLVTQTTVGNGSPAVPAFTITLLVYISISLVTSLFVNIANRRVALVER